MQEKLVLAPLFSSRESQDVKKTGKFTFGTAHIESPPVTVGELRSDERRELDGRHRGWAN